MSFRDIAIPMARRGVRQVPALNPRDRFPGPKGWPTLATTDEATITEWSSNGYADFNSCSVADGNLIIIDVDNYQRAKELGFPVFKTFTVMTPGQGYHFYVKGTERAKAIGNRAVPGVAEFKCYSAAVAAPGSIRDDTSGEYVVRRDLPIIDCPPAVVDWFEKYAPRKKSRYAVPVANDFDFEDWCEHYGIAGHQNGTFFITDVCPLAGVKHSGSKATGFYWDGEFLGFKCFSDDCPISIGELIRHMNETHEPYGRIWPDDDSTLDVDWVEEETVKEKTLTPTKMIIETTHETIEADQLLAAMEAASGVKYPELRFPYGALSGRFKELVDKACEGGVGTGLVVPALMTLASSIPVYDVMCGQRICLFTCLLAMVGAGKDVSILHARLTLGLEDKWHKKLFTNYSPSGEKVLAMVLGDKMVRRGGNGQAPGREAGPRRHCLISTELESTLNKAKAETSGVLQAIQRLWDSNYDTYPDSKNGSTITVDCRFSWLCALPVGKNEIDVELFRQAFGANTQGGIVSRMTFGFTEQRVDSRKLRHWKAPIATKSIATTQTVKVDDADVEIVTDELIDNSLMDELRTARVEDWRPEVGAQLDEWNPGDDMSGRDTQHIQKAAIISALLNGHKYVEQADFDFALAYMDWQTQIRKVFNTGLGKSAQGMFNDTIVEAVRRRVAKYKKDDDKNICSVGGLIFVRWKKMAKDGNWHLYGPDIERTIDALVRGGLLAYLTEDQYGPDGQIIKKNKENKVWIRLRN